MKENTEIIGKAIYTPFPSGTMVGKLTKPLYYILKNRISPVRSQLIEGIASLGIGIFFMLAIFLFCTQLAEYGWQ
ncbi:MAG: hypothetical protein WBB23_01240 [Desulforhopalus sp.]